MIHHPADSDSNDKIPEFVFVRKSASELDDVSCMDFSERSPAADHNESKPFSWCLHSRQNDSLKMILPSVSSNTRASQTSCTRLPSLPQRRASMNFGDNASTIGSGSKDLIGDILMEAEAILSGCSDLFSLGETQVSSDEDKEEKEDECLQCSERVKSGGKIPVPPQRKASFDGCIRRGRFANDDEASSSKKELFAHGAKDERPPRFPQRKYLSPKQGGQPTERKITESFSLPTMSATKNPTKVMASTA